MPIKVKCKFCKQYYFISPCQKGKSSFCSRKCKAEFQRKSMRGKNNHMFGISLKNPRKGKTLEEYHGKDNARLIRDLVSKNTKLGMQTDVAKKNIAIGLSKRKMPKGHYQRLGKMCIGRKHSQNTKDKISKGNIGKICPMSARKRIGDANRKHWAEGNYDHINFGHWLIGKKHSPELIEKIRTGIIKALAKRKCNVSPLEKQFFIDCKKIIPKIKTQFNFFNKFVVDGAIPKKKIVIEFYGDYWHGNPIKFKELTLRQLQQLRRDKYRKEEILKIGWELIVFWEYDYKHFPNKIFKKLKNV